MTRTLGIGTAPYMAVCGPAINDFDVALLKNITFKEQRKIQFGAEFFNIANHPQFEGVGGGIGSATFGVVTSARDPRVVQLRLKFSF